MKVSSILAITATLGTAFASPAPKGTLVGKGEVVTKTSGATSTSDGGSATSVSRAASTTSGAVGVRGVVCNKFHSRGGLAGAAVAKSLQKTVEKGVDQLCNKGFQSGNNDNITKRFGSTVLTLSRTNDKQPSERCKTHFNDLIEQCIGKENLWGGTVSTDGLLYKIEHEDIAHGSSTDAALGERGLEDEDAGNANLAARGKKHKAHKPTKSKHSKKLKPSTSKGHPHITKSKTTAKPKSTSLKGHSKSAKVKPTSVNSDS